MNRILLISIIFILNQPVLAMDLNEEEVCKYNGTSRHDVQCSNQRFKAVEEILNVKYKELMSKLDEAISKEPERLKDLKVKYVHAQRAWVAFREKECSAFKVWYTNGTLQKSYYYDCMKKMAHQRINEFDHFANPGK